MAISAKGGLKKGKAIPIRSVVRQGMTDQEVYYNTKIKTIRNQLVHGFASRENIELPKELNQFPIEAIINVMVFEILRDENIVKLLFPGELLTGSNPVSVNAKEVEQLIADQH